MNEVNVEYGKEMSILFSGIIIPSPLIMGSTPIEILCNKYCAPYNVERHIIGLHHGFICLSLYLCYYVIVSHSSSLNPPYHWIPEMILKNHTSLKVYKCWRILPILKTPTIKCLAIFFKKYFNLQGFYINYIIIWRFLG